MSIPTNHTDDTPSSNNAPSTLREAKRRKKRLAEKINAYVGAPLPLNIDDARSVTRDYMTPKISRQARRLTRENTWPTPQADSLDIQIRSGAPNDPGTKLEPTGWHEVTRDLDADERLRKAMQQAVAHEGEVWTKPASGGDRARHYWR